MNRAHQTTGVARSERGCGRARVNAGEPERFGRVNVADTSDNALIEERKLDRNTPGCERALEMRCVERRVDRVGTEYRRDRASGVEQLDGGERARIGEDDAAAVVELQNETREARKLGVDALHHPIAGHAKMHVQRRAVIEHGKLVLAAPIDARHGPAHESPQPRPAQPAPDVRVRHRRARDARA